MAQSSLPSTEPTVIEKVVAFVDERIGLKQMQAKMLNERLRPGQQFFGLSLFRGRAFRLQNFFNLSFFVFRIVLRPE